MAAVEQVEDRWPVVELSRRAVGYPLYLKANSLRADEFETYYPSSHPALLSKEEAEAIAQGASPLPPGVRKRLAAWCLSAYADEGEPNA